MAVRIFLLLLSVPCLLECCAPKENVVAQDRINHIVMCWLKEPGNLDHRERIIETTRSLSRIPGVREVRAGQAIQSVRNVVDDSFDVGVYITFNSAEDMRMYEAHPMHENALKEVLLPLVERVVVYDFIE